jgi:HEPN domain-containing protein
MYEPSLAGAAYHCQQAAEKIIEGLLIVAAATFPYTHNLAALGDIAMRFYAPYRDTFIRLSSLTLRRYAFRYPGTGILANDPPGPDEIDAALQDVDVLATLLGPLTTPT